MSSFTGANDVARMLRQLPKTLAELEALAVNQVAKDAVNRATDAIAANLNLPREYIKSHIKIIRRAKADQTEAVVSAKPRPILLSRYGMKPLTQQVRNPKRAKGDASRGIPKGRKGAGAGVQVKAGGASKFIPGFLVRLKSGGTAGGNGFGLAVRDKSQPLGYKVLHGPSLHSAWNFASDAIKADLGRQVQTTFEQLLARQLRSL